MAGPSLAMTLQFGRRSGATRDQVGAIAVIKRKLDFGQSVVVEFD
jgi:hypothetical protein